MKDGVDRRARSLYGEELRRGEGVLHVVAVAREEGGLRPMRIGPAPTSETDAFALGLTRARVDAILLTGSILRAEPELRYDLPPALAVWRREVLGLSEPPLLLVLTRGDVPAEHPIWEGEAQPVVYTSEAGLKSVEALPKRVVRVVEKASPSPTRALRYLRKFRGCRAISVEAGPTVAVPLYDEPSQIDELLLSVFEGKIPKEARGGYFLDVATLAEKLELCGGPTTVEEPSGRWTFSRWRRESWEPG